MVKVEKSSGTENLDLKTGKIEISIVSVEVFRRQRTAYAVFGEQNILKK